MLKHDRDHHMKRLAEIRAERQRIKKALLSARNLYETPGIGIYEQPQLFREIVGNIVTKYWDNLSAEEREKECLAHYVSL